MAPKLESKWSKPALKKIDMVNYHDHRIRKIRELNTCVIRDKRTKEIVNLEVSQSKNIS